MITVYCGPMFAGKTEAIINCVQKRVQGILNPDYAIAFKPASDTRDAPDVIRDHNGISWPAQSVATAGDILNLVPKGCQVVVIDEGQFFGAALIPVVQKLSDDGLDVYIACLDMDSNRLPFGAVGDLLAIADYVHKLKAPCAVCREAAPYTLRTVANANRNFIGGAESYSPRCLKHWLPK